MTGELACSVVDVAVHIGFDMAGACVAGCCGARIANLLNMQISMLSTPTSGALHHPLVALQCPYGESPGTDHLAERKDVLAQRDEKQNDRED